MKPSTKQARPRGVRPENFKIEFPGDVTVRRLVSDGMQKVRQHLVTFWNRPVSNSDILKYLISLHRGNDEGNPEHGYCNFTTYQEADNSQDVNQITFVTTDKSLQKCVSFSAHHARFCPAELQVQKVIRRGHVAGTVTLSCSHRQGTVMNMNK